MVDFALPERIKDHIVKMAQSAGASSRNPNIEIPPVYPLCRVTLTDRELQRNYLPLPSVGPGHFNNVENQVLDNGITLTVKALDQEPAAPAVAEPRVFMTRMHVKKDKGTNVYYLTRSWDKIRDRQRLARNDNVSVWYFRFDGYIWFVLHR